MNLSEDERAFVIAEINSVFENARSSLNRIVKRLNRNYGEEDNRLDAIGKIINIVTEAGFLKELNEKNKRKENETKWRKTKNVRNEIGN